MGSLLMGPKKVSGTFSMKKRFLTPFSITILIVETEE
jgi:hypothetical protein